MSHSSAMLRPHAVQSRSQGLPPPPTSTPTYPAAISALSPSPRLVRWPLCASPPHPNHRYPSLARACTPMMLSHLACSASSRHPSTHPALTQSQPLYIFTRVPSRPQRHAIDRAGVSSGTVDWILQCGTSSLMGSPMWLPGDGVRPPVALPGDRPGTSPAWPHLITRHCNPLGGSCSTPAAAYPVLQPRDVR